MEHCLGDNLQENKAACSVEWKLFSKIRKITKKKKNKTKTRRYKAKRKNKIKHTKNVLR